MARWFNIGGPCNPADHYMLSATERLPEVVSLVNKKQYFVVHAPRQCGKTTAFRALMDEINAKGEMAALYCSVESVQEFTDPDDGMREVAGAIRDAVQCDRSGALGGLTDAGLKSLIGEVDTTNVVKRTLNVLSEHIKKPLLVFFDEVDCLCDGTLVSFLRQLRNGRISCTAPGSFPISVALIGMRNIRDYKARIRPNAETLGSASPFNVITKAMTLRLFTEEEIRALYRQHTEQTGQIFEEEALKLAWQYSKGQPYLVNALARWCVEEIHHEDFSKPITGEDMHEAKEKIIRERGTHVDSLMERLKEPRVRRIVEPVMTGGERTFSRNDDDYSYVIDLGLLVEDDDGELRPANPMYAEIIGRYLSRDDQDDMKRLVRETPWVKDNGLDMPGLMTAFQQFWRENAGANKAPFDYNESYPHIVMQAFLQRVLNGGGEIIREMSLGRGALDLGVKFRGATYPVEVKMLYNYEKSHEKSYDQMLRYIDHLGEREGWLVVFDPDFTKPWEQKIANEDITRDDKTIHVVRC